MQKNLSFEEIQHLYPSEWVLIAYTELDDNFKVVRGEVLAHSSNRNDVYNAISSRNGKSIAVEYMGSIPEDFAVIL